MNDYRQSDSSTEIKADIEQTRAQMENKINQIQSKLDPERLKEQAQETVRSMVTDSGSAVMDYMREHREEIGASMLDAVKRNPVPAALIGLGLGWLALESMSPKRDRYDYDRNRYLPVRRDEAVRYESGYSYDNRYAGSSNWNEEQWNAYGRTPTYGEWQGSSAPEHQRYAAGGTAPYRGVERPYTGDYADQGSQDRSRLQEAKEQVVGQAQNVAESVKDAAQTVGEKAGDAVDAVRDAVSQAGERVRSGAEHIADRARDEAEHMGYRMEQMGYQTRSRADQFGHEMGYRGQAMGMQARQVGRRIENQVEENPMMIGAVAFAVGAAVAMLMPQSRVENRYIGEARDRVMESAKELGQDVGERAQRVVEEVRPDLEQSAKKLVEEVKQVGKEAAQDLQNTAQKAQEKAKQEGEGLKATAETKVNQAAADLKTPENWTTLKGRWNEIKGEAKRQWGKLTDDDLTRIEGDYEKLVGLIQQKYGYSRSQAEQEVGTFSRSRA